MKGIFQIPNINSYFKTAKLFASYKFYCFKRFANLKKKMTKDLHRAFPQT